MPTYETEKDRRTERYVRDVLRELGWKVWWHNDPDRPVASPHGGDLTALQDVGFVPRDLKRPYVPIEVKRRKGDWEQFEDYILDVRKVEKMHGWSDTQPRVLHNHAFKGLTTPPKGPAMFIVVTDDLLLRKVWLTDPERWPVADFVRTKGQRGDLPDRVYHIPRMAFTVWQPMGVAYPSPT